MGLSHRGGAAPSTLTSLRRFRSPSSRQRKNRPDRAAWPWVVRVRRQPQFPSTIKKSVMPTWQSPSKSAGHDGGHGSGHGPQTANSIRKSVMPTRPSQSTSPTKQTVSEADSLGKLSRRSRGTTTSHRPRPSSHGRRRSHEPDRYHIRYHFFGMAFGVDGNQPWRYRYGRCACSSIG